jgi:GNAT superfamily N-acetyltransferase
MPEIEVVAAEAGRLHRKFFQFPYQFYGSYPCWVPPLRTEEQTMLGPRHPFFQHAERGLFVALRDGRTVGRIAAILDRNAPSEQGRCVGSFGYFESIDDIVVARGLFDAARAWLADRGAHLMRGPVHPSINYSAGLLVEGFDDPPCIGMLYNPPYYGSLIENAGLGKAKDLLALRITLDQLRSPMAERFARFALRYPGLRLRSCDTARPERDGQILWEVYSKAWSANWGYAPASPEEFQLIGKQLLEFADPRLVQFCEIDGRAVGLVCALPDLNQALQRCWGRLLPFGWWHIVRIKKTATRARVMILGVAPAWQGTGVAAAFLALAKLPGTDHYKDIEASWVLEDNLAAMRGLQLLGARVYKRYRLYEGSVRGDN